MSLAKAMCAGLDALVAENAELRARLEAAEKAEPVAWIYELANARNVETDEPCNWGKPKLSFTPPCAGKYQRNVEPLYRAIPPTRCNRSTATHRHKKRGTGYALIGIGRMQCDWWQITGDGHRYPVDMREVAIYCSTDDGSLWVRPREEFEDGRFEALTSAPNKLVSEVAADDWAEINGGGVVTSDQVAEMDRRHPEQGGPVQEITAERRRQIEVEGWTPEHDDSHANREMALAAASYAIGKPDFGGKILWPWASRWWKPHGNRRNLVKAAALIVAEIERLDRAALTGGGK